MRTKFVLTIIGLTLFITATSQEKNTLKDKDGNAYSIKLMADNKWWTTNNLAINIPDSYCFNDSVSYCERFGRLYTWQSAIDGCKAIGEGWRLPAEHEWKLLAAKYGGVFGYSKDSGRTAYTSLMIGGNSGFNAVPGGNREPDTSSYARLNAHGFYWTITESKTGMAWFYNFGRNSGKLFRQEEGEKQRAFSVRCVKDTQLPKEK